MELSAACKGPRPTQYHNTIMRGVGEGERDEGLMMMEKEEEVVPEMTQGGGWECSHPCPSQLLDR